MANIISLYDKLVIKTITYEAGDEIVKAKCEVWTTLTERTDTTILISHTDLNRIIAKVAAGGFEFTTTNTSAVVLEDGTEVIDYSFENVFKDGIILEDFEFVNKVKEIRA